MTALAGTWGLIRLVLRRDRFLLPLWIVILGLLPIGYASGTRAAYPSDKGLHEYYASIAANPAFTSTAGPIFGDSLGAVIAWRCSMVMIITGLISLLTVVRHTRTEEDAGRRELLGSAAVGRGAPLAAALIVTFVADLVLGGLVALTMGSYGDTSGIGALALGLSFALMGWMFGALGGVVAQLTEGAGAARGIGIAVIAAAFALRAVGDAGGESGSLSWLSWVSPIGWVPRLEPYVDEQWWVLVPILGFVVVLLVAAGVLVARRDAGAGVLPARLGPALAPSRFRSPFALAWRLHRGALIAWSFGFLVLGLLFGSTVVSIDDMVRDSPELARMMQALGGTDSIVDAALGTLVGLAALMITGYAVQAALRLRSEESATHAEPVLATAVSRIRWMGSHLVFAFVGPALAAVLVGVGTGLTSSAGSGRDIGDQVGRMLGAALAQLPAIWLVAGIAVAAFGLLPRAATAIAWGALGACVFVSFVGPIIRLDQAILDVSPFEHVPKMPGEAFTATPLLWLFGIVVLLVGIGLAGFRRRDTY